MTVMIPRNTTIPTQKKEIFSTATDSQPSVEVHVLQASDRGALQPNARSLPSRSIMPAPRGVPKVRVTFDIDANGILSVHAKDTATGKDRRITITAELRPQRRPDQEYGKEAAEHEAETRNVRADRTAQQARQPLLHAREDDSENKEKDSGIGTCRRSRASFEKPGRPSKKQDDDGVKAATEKLEKEAHRIAAVMYQGAGPGAPPADTGATPPADEGGTLPTRAPTKRVA